MRRTLADLVVGAVLGLAAGGIWFAWSDHDFGGECGFRLPGRPHGPTTFGDVLLIALPGLLMAGIKFARTQSPRRALGYGILTALLAAVAVAAAVLYWIVSRRCTE